MEKNTPTWCKTGQAKDTVKWSPKRTNIGMKNKVFVPLSKAQKKKNWKRRKKSQWTGTKGEKCES